MFKDKYKITNLCSYLDVSRSGYYKWVKKGCNLHYNFNKEIAQLIKNLFNEKNKGYRYINMQLERKYGVRQDPKTTFRYMNILGLKSPIRKRRYQNTKPSEVHQGYRIVSPNILNRDFKSEEGQGDRKNVPLGYDEVKHLGRIICPHVPLK